MSRLKRIIKLRLDVSLKQSLETVISGQNHSLPSPRHHVGMYWSGSEVTRSHGPRRRWHAKLAGVCARVRVDCEKKEVGQQSENTNTFSEKSVNM